MSSPLDDVRTEIDSIDKELVELFEKRMATVKKVADIKKEANIRVTNPEREEEIVENISNQVSPEYRTYVKSIFTSLMDVSRSYQYTIVGQNDSIRTKLGEVSNLDDFTGSPRVLCQGVKGAYSGIAASKMFENGDISFCQSWNEIFEALECGEADFGVLPVENSLAGSVNEVYDLLLKHNLYICKALRLGINHCLLGRKDATIDDIVEIYSHPQAISQCKSYLDSLSDVRVIPLANTAVAAKMVADLDDNTKAAIASPECATTYGLKILDDKLHHKNNSTRFIAISNKIFTSPNANKISLVFHLPHCTGSLYRTLGKFASLDLNLTKLESRHIEDKDFEYAFYLDFTGNVRSESIIELLCSLSSDLPAISFLGNYYEP